MSVIQSIQEKYAKLMAIIIAVALMIFVVMLAFENGGSLFRGNSTTVGRVNGTSIDYTDFYQKVQQQEANIAAQYGGNVPEGMRPQAVESAWNQEVNEIILNEELDKLGIKVGKRELGDLLYGPNGPDEFKRIPGFTDTITGQYNGQYAKQQIDALLRMKKGTVEQLQQRDQFIAFISYQQRKRMGDKYTSLLTNSINFPKWFVEKQIADNSQLAKISLVRDNYSNHGSDSIKVSDSEIKEYLDKHKEDYKQPESRSVSYVAFSTKPSSADSAAAKDKLNSLRTQFDTTKNLGALEAFLNSQGLAFPETYSQTSALPPSIKDTISKLPVNTIIGPYVESNSWMLAKAIDTRREPEMVKVRHILIATARQDPQSRQWVPVKDTTEARHLIDSIQTTIQKGIASFDSLALKFSDDNPNFEDKKSNKYKIGIYDSVKHAAMVPEFDNFIFGHPVGSKGVVKTQFGFHYIEILAQEGKSFETYRVAYLPVPIESSNETDANATNDANRFASVARDQKSFDASAEKLMKEKGIQKSIANDILPSSYYVGTLGEARSLVKNIYDAKLGEVLEPQKAGDAYVVAVVTEINEEGTQSLAKARASIEPILKNKKIAESLKKKLGTITTLEAAAAALGGKPIETIDSIRMTGVQTTAAAR
ncbi:MAG TPA: SurA N-terminal domain-containing protein, partial [Chitinophagaceae bacterium]|nr:SurA N-terminal domain-containing protein [Chitinophagaceae bacterium]